MRPFAADQSAMLRVQVTPEMTVNFGELGRVHPVYATYWLAQHFEEVGRKLLLPHLEAGEGGIGSQVEVDHVASALPGMTVTLTATFERQEGRRVHMTMRALSSLGDLIGTGRTVQVVLPQERIDAGFAHLRERWAAHQAQEARAGGAGPES